MPFDYDLKITGGLLVDGTGTPGRRADVAIKDGRIVALGDAPGSAAREIDATGRVVCPGFVDVHTHYDAQVLWDKLLSISPWHGVTTVVMGNCGFGIAPVRRDHRPLIVQTLEKVEGMSGAALREGLGDWGFETFPEYLDVVEKRGTAINVAALLGHTPLRLYVMGEEATEREATDEERAAMRRILQEALDAGALGLATSKFQGHLGFQGRQVASRAAAFDEVRELVSTMRDAGHGMLQTTLGSGLMLEQIEQLAVESGVPISWSALLAGSAFGKSTHHDQLAKTVEMAGRGLRVAPQVTPRPLNFEFQFREPGVLEGMSFFKPVAAADFRGKLAIYRDPMFRQQFRDRWDTAWPGLRHSFEQMAIVEFAAEPALEERMVVDVARERNVHPVDLVLDMALATELQARFRIPLANHDEDQVQELLTNPAMVLGLSDAGAHASQLCDACQATHLLGRWVREKKVLSLEQAVRMLTTRPAEVFGITDRGLLAVGRSADVVVFDPDTVAAGPLRRVNDLPAGEPRLVSDAIGVDAVIVNGVVVREQGRDALVAGDAMPGRLLRKGRG
ncbi:N-acyl-D-amino-acid deacylase family protein [Ramlibacter albus]|uniref:Amidohydrolase family protein n=1 Tax=Ramlibacter albus TaxID=2079448 RepID=A0A923MDI7_9BURK|nr:amidohydrolase family protein [Ramlibacter albus]